MTDQTEFIDTPDERYVSRDKRDLNKVIKIIGEESGPRGRRLVAQVISNDGSPQTIGRRTTMTPKNLDKRYRKISH